MEIRYLMEFTIVAGRLNFSDAADDLFISQATLSKHIAAMENELGCKLFDRSTHHVALTESGKLLLPSAMKIVETYHDCMDSMDRSQAIRRKTIRVASIPVIEPYKISETILAFQKEHPAISMQISEVEGRDIPRLLQNGDYDLAFQRLSRETMRQYHFTKYCSDNVIAVLPAGHPLAVWKTLPLARLKEEHFLFMDENTGFYDVCLEACREAGFEPAISYKGHRPENILGLVAKGMGVSLLLRREVEFYKNPGVIGIPLAHPIISNIYLTNPKQVSLTYPYGLFVDYIKKQNGELDR
jgi:LysR family transcriptional activator of glutamate synthase operon